MHTSADTLTREKGGREENQLAVQKVVGSYDDQAGTDEGKQTRGGVDCGTGWRALLGKGEGENSGGQVLQGGPGNGSKRKCPRNVSERGLHTKRPEVLRGKSGTTPRVEKRNVYTTRPTGQNQVKKQKRKKVKGTKSKGRDKDEFYLRP